MKKNYKNHIIATLLLFVFAACSPSSQDVADNSLKAKDQETKKIEASAIVGMWDTGKDIYNFYEDGRFETVNNLPISGYKWKLVGNDLILSFLDSPANKPKEEVYTFDAVRTARLTFKGEEDSKIIWNRSKEKVLTAKPSLFYLERIALPPEVLVHYQITQDNGKKVINSGYFSYKGAVPIAFNALYLEKNIDTNMPVELMATLYYNDNALFTTKTPAILDSFEKQDIRLLRANNEENSPAKLNAPQAFYYSLDAEDALYSAKLYLEDKHLFFLIQDKDMKNDGIEKKESFITWGYWNQVGRGHSLELIVAGKETLTGAVNQKSEVFFDSLPLFDSLNNINFMPLDERMNKNIYFTLKGNVTKRNNEFYFIPNGLVDSFKLLGNVLVNPELSKLGNNKSLYIELNASYADEGYFNVQNIITTESAKNTENTSDKAQLKNTYWRLTELNGKPKANNSPAEPHFILNIEDANTTSGKGAGSDGCNSFFFTWENKESSIDFVLGGSTMRLCPEEGVEAQSREFLQALDKADSFIIQGSSLELRQKDKELAKFESVAL